MGQTEYQTGNTENIDCMLKECVLAMYDIRGKQKFIYRSKKIKEIVGGSSVIKNLFINYLFSNELCGEQGSYPVFNDENVPFTVASFRERLNQGYVGELIYSGGGNFLVLFKNKNVYDAVTYEFTKKVIKETATLNVLPTCIPVTSFSNFHCVEKDSYGRTKGKGDYERLYAVHHANEARDTGIRPWGTLPVTRIDNATSMPLTKYMKIAFDGRQQGKGAVWRMVSAESAKKYEEYGSMDDNDKNKMGARFLDDLVEKKGEDSLLAVIYVDGNNMGAQVQQCIENSSSYEDCIRELRNFSKRIQDEYIEVPLKKIDEKLVELHGSDVGSRRMIVYAGDEITFICNAHDALEIVETYFASLPESNSSCAGICIFQSHMPYADAYRIAEGCCENGKEKMRELGVKNACLVDFHYCQGAIGTSIKEIRNREETADSSTPWVVRGSQDDAENERLKVLHDVSKVKTMKGYMNAIGRTNLKGLAVPIRYSKADYYLELERIRAHMKKEHKSGIDFNLMKSNSMLIGDMIMVYDLWFRAKGGNDNNGEE